MKAWDRAELFEAVAGMVLQVPPGALFAEAVYPTAWTTTWGSGSSASLDRSPVFDFSGIPIAYRDEEMKVVGLNGSAKKTVIMPFWYPSPDFGEKQHEILQHIDLVSRSCAALL